MNAKDPFDDLEKLQAPVTDAELRSMADARKRARHPSRRDLFAKMPLGWVSQLVKAKVLHSADQMAVLIHLVHHATFSDAPIEATSKNTGRADPHVKLKTIRMLETAGVAEVEWRGPRKCPLIKLFVGKLAR